MTNDDDPIHTAFAPLRRQTAAHDEAAVALASARSQRQTRSRRMRRLVVVVVAPITLAFTIGLALAPGGREGDGGRAVAFSPERAEAALTPSRRIIELTIRLERHSDHPNVVAEPPTLMREWSGASQVPEERC